MRALVVDTDVVSCICKKDTRAALYEPHLANALTSISFMTLAELERWAIARNWGTRRHAEMLATAGTDDHHRGLTMKKPVKKGSAK